MQIQKKQQLAQLRRWRIRKKILGSAERPRMAVKFTNQHIYVQFIDDTKGVTIAAASTRPPKGEKATGAGYANVTGAKRIGAAAASAAKAKGVTQVVFDRAGARYHGKVAALADAAREAGLKF